MTAKTLTAETHKTGLKRSRTVQHFTNLPVEESSSKAEKEKEIAKAKKKQKQYQKERQGCGMQ